jgi:hypothetical protein
MENKILQILSDNSIPYVLKGPNVGKKAIVAINCPFCKDDDGHHLGILKGKDNFYFTCWRHHSHSGTLPALLSYLLHISILEAKDLLDENIFLESTNLLDKIQKMCYTNTKKLEEEHKGVTDLEFLPTFRDFVTNFYTPETPFWNYLQSRGFLSVPRLTNYFRLKYSISDDGWNNRIIIPFYLNKKLVSWIGRSIDPNNTLRYKNLAKEESVIHPKALLFNYDLLLRDYDLTENRVLYITEGVFDAMKLQWYSPKEVQATAILTTTMSDEQIALLYNIAHGYKKILILLDKGAESQAISLVDKLSFLPNVGLRFLPSDYPDDPGDMTEKQVLEFTTKEINEKN